MSDFNAKRNSGRRAFLRGVGGVTLGLPLLEFTHGKAWAAGETYGKRFITVYSHGGETMNIDAQGVHRDGSGTGPKLDDWRAKAGWTFGEAHETFRGTPLEAKLTVLRGIDNDAGYNYGYNGGHGSNNSSALTAATLSPGPEQDTEVAHGPSLDWVVAQRLAARLGGRSTPLHYFVSGHTYGSPFFKGTPGQLGQRQEGELNPAAAWTATFSGVMSGGGGPDPAVVRASQTKKSVLNQVMESYRQFAAKVGAADRTILNAHLDHLTDLEKQIKVVGETMQCTVPGKPYNEQSWSNPHQDLTGPALADLIVAALRCGLTNVANLEIADIMTPLYNTAGPDGHDMGHRIQLYGGGDAGDQYLKDILASGNYPAYSEWLSDMRATRKWRLDLAKRIATGLNDSAFPEGNGTMLDNSLILYTSDSSCGGSHTVTRDMPYLLLGSAGGYLKTGHYVDFNPKRKANPASLAYGGEVASSGQLYTTILNAMGEPDTTFGDPKFMYGKTGGLSELR